MNSFILFNKRVVAFLVLSIQSPHLTFLFLSFVYFSDILHLSVNNSVLYTYCVPGTELVSVSSMTLVMIQQDKVVNEVPSPLLRTEVEEGNESLQVPKPLQF